MLFFMEDFAEAARVYYESGIEVCRILCASTGANRKRSISRFSKYFLPVLLSTISKRKKIASLQQNNDKIEDFLK